MLEMWLFFILTVFYTSTNHVSSEILSTHDSYLTQTSSVNLQDGLYLSYTFSCSITSLHGPVPSYTPDYKWIYYTHSSSDYVQRFDGIDVLYNSTYFNTSLTIYSYNPGYYQCQYEFDGTKHSHNFQIEGYGNIPGVDLHEECMFSGACYALNSTCVNSTCVPGVPCSGTCECVAPYDINFNGKDTTPACLTNESIGSHCNIDEECAVQNSEDEYKCINNVCAIDANACNNDEDCAANYKCVDNECTETNAADVSFSRGAIAGIVIGALTGVILIG